MTFTKCQKKEINKNMKKIFDEITNVFEKVTDMKKTLEICSYGLETAGEIKAISVVELYRDLLDDVENQLMEIIEQMEKENSPEETITGIVE